LGDLERAADLQRRATGGFDLHAKVTVAANNRDGLEQLTRYDLRPPIAESA
jgi:hypothetical protein